MLPIQNISLYHQYVHPQYLIAQATIQSNKYVNSFEWRAWLSSVRNDRIKFEARWVIIRDGIRENRLNYGLIKTSKGLETGLKNPRYGVVQVPYAVSPGKSPPFISGPPPGWTTDSILYPEVRIFIINPHKVYWLSNSNDQRILDELINLLDEPNRAWAAHITLSKMLGITGLSSKVDRISPSQWWELEGKTQKAKQEWTQYLQKVKPSMVWNPLGGYYKHRAPDGRFIL
jgi:hypothetical protein